MDGAVLLTLALFSCVDVPRGQLPLLEGSISRWGELIRTAM